MKLNTRVAAVGAALLLIAPLAACSQEEPKQATSKVEKVESTTPKPKLEEPARSERGHIIKKVGELGGLGDPHEVEFTVTGITPDPVCTADYTVPPKNGHFLKVDLELRATPEAQGELVYGTNSVWKWIDKNGTTANSDPATGNGMSCIPDAEELPSSIGPGENQVGSIILDVPTIEGTLVFTPSYAGYADADGWEWAVPAL